MSQRPEPSTFSIELPFGYSFFKWASDLKYYDIERSFCLSLPTTMLVITSAQGNRYNQERRVALDLDDYKALWSYDDKVQGTTESHKFSKPDLFRAMASIDCSRL